jgi:hypothetical protein
LSQIWHTPWAEWAFSRVPVGISFP